MRTALTVLSCLVCAATAWSQPATAYTQARMPEQRQLDRLNLKQSWTIALPIEGMRDGIATVQLMPVPDPTRKGSEIALLIVQMRSGTIAVYRADSGRKLWSKQPPPAYPTKIHDVAYDPRGALIVVRDLNMYRYDLYATQTSASATDETDNRLVTLPSMPSAAPIVVIADPSKRDEAVIIVCFNGNKLSVYGQPIEQPRVRPDTSTLNWKVRYSEDSVSIFKPGINKAPSLAVMRSVFGPDYGLKNRSAQPEPPSPSVTMIHNLSRPNETSTNISSTPSLTIVDTLTRLSEYNQRDVRGAALDATSRRGDMLDFRLGQAPSLIRSVASDQYGRGSGIITKLVLVGSDRDIQIDGVSEKIGLLPERKIGRDLLRTGMSAPAAFLGTTMFIPTSDSTVYAIDSDHGLVAWTTTLQSVPNHRPAVVAPHLFVTTRTGKMFRLTLDDGGPAMGGSFEGDGSFPGIRVRQFLAANDSRVYAVDQSGKLVVFDRRRGTVQGQVDVSGFTTTLLNDTTDQVILGSNDGKLICLRDAGSSGTKLYRSNAQPDAPAPKAPVGVPSAPPAEKPAAPAAPKAPKPMAGAKPADGDKPMPK